MNSRFFKRKNKGRFSFQKPREVKEKSCGVILFRMEEAKRLYLLLHYPSGHWDLPKGHVEEEDASEFATALRELEEETGISEIEFIDGYREPMYYEFNRGRKEVVKKTVVYFLASTDVSKVKISHEHQDYEWLPYEEAYDRLTFDNAKTLLERGESHIQSSTP